MGLEANKFANSDSVSLYDQVYHACDYAYDFTSKSAGNIAKTASSKATQLYGQIHDLKNRYLTTEYLTTKTKQWAYAKVCPTSSPPGIDKQINQIKGEIAGLMTIKARRKSNLAALNKKIEIVRKQTEHNQIKPAQKNKLNKLMQSRAVCKKQITGLKEKLTEKRDILTYLDIKKKSTIGGRFTGYAGMIANAVIPGSGIVVGTTLTAINLLTQQGSVSILPDDQNIKKEEQKNVDYGTLLGVAAAITSVAFSTWVMPVIMESARAWGGANNSPTF